MDRMTSGHSGPACTTGAWRVAAVTISWCHSYDSCGRSWVGCTADDIGLPVAGSVVRANCRSFCAGGFHGLRVLCCRRRSSVSSDCWWSLIVGEGQPTRIRVSSADWSTAATTGLTVTVFSNCVTWSLSLVASSAGPVASNAASATRHTLQIWRVSLQDLQSYRWCESPHYGKADKPTFIAINNLSLLHELLFFGA